MVNKRQHNPLISDADPLKNEMGHLTLGTVWIILRCTPVRTGPEHDIRTTFTMNTHKNY